ncbi:helix-turn-helix domain-containing protein [Phenylobacterium sp.]|jgi:IclR family transcriptional regulator, mhp operon transcriptional activator|uniref:helix-turn-helix domain-containing protein n=1 Tax=Phenylobacterium sp. TaxID=1871053 RepID=UPI0012239101|nr:helix-turn-helix domain-containing protein [Phenylobacterium sp.]THD59912.1 MAG: transcriptional regulator [Phenylobacterium sp.]
MENDHVQSLTRGLAVLEAMNRSRVSSLSALHTLTGLPKSSLVRLLETLIEGGYVVRISRREGYALTDAVLRLSSGVRHRDLVVDVARPLMEAFTRRHKWQVSLATSETDSMLVRFTTRHISPFSRDENFLNRRVGMLRSAVGRAYFAWCSQEEREFVLNVLMAAGDALAQPDRAEELAALLAQVRSDGYATIERPRTDATRSFAVPVMEPGEGEPLGALAFFYYRSTMTEPQATRRYLALVTTLAADISAGLEQARARVEPAAS